MNATTQLLILMAIIGLIALITWAINWFRSLPLWNDETRGAEQDTMFFEL